MTAKHAHPPLHKAHRKFAKTHKAAPRPDFECISLLLQGGGALGAYQAGVYEALAEADLHPDWVAGISIGAINSAVIAGNAPEERVGKLRQFWEQITSSTAPAWPIAMALTASQGELARKALNQTSAALALLSGAPGFFAPRMPAPWLSPDGSQSATSHYDTGNLRSTLESLVDFDRINAAEMRFSVGAVNVRSGNFVYFDTTTHHIGPQHVMASGALPPGFPAVEIDGEFYWDGGLVSNTPLQWVVHGEPRRDMLAFQVDLWSARGDLPRNLADVTTRQKEIQFSSRTRAGTTEVKELQRVRAALCELIDELPEELRHLPAVEYLRPLADRKCFNIVHLIYQARHYEGDSKDYEFSRASMEDHWRAGYQDGVRTLRHPEIFERPTNRERVFTFDLAVDGRE